MTATAFPLVRPSSWCVSWSDTARDATTEPPSGIGLFVAQRDKFSDRLATRFSREEKFLCDVVARWHAMPRARTSFQRILCWCRGDAEGRHLSCLFLWQRFAPREGDRLVTKRYSSIHGNIVRRVDLLILSENENEYWKLHKNTCNCIKSNIFSCNYFLTLFFL